VTSLVRSDDHHQTIDSLRSRVGGLEQTLEERAADLVRTRSALEAFRIRYRSDVGLLHEQLDELEAALAEAELGELTKRIEEREARTGQAAAPSGDRIEAPPRFTTDAVRKLFREVAKAIHPDRAGDDDARGRRHSLMIEANKAYALGDEEQLRSILLAWERSPDAVEGSGDEAMRERLLRRIAQVEEHLDLLDAELASLQASSLWQLKAMVDEEAAKGKDLIADMVRRLKRDILVTTNRLEAMRSVYAERPPNA
jgi:hypothetical protein